MLAAPLPIHGLSPFDDILEKLELLEEGTNGNDDMKEVWDQLSEPTSSPASSSEANSPSILASSSESDDLAHHFDEGARYMTRISPPLTPLPPLTLIYQVPTKPKNRNPYLLLEENLIEIHFGYTIPMKLQLYLPGESAVELPYPVSVYAKLTQADTDRDVTELLSFETPGHHSQSSASVTPPPRKVRPSLGLQCCINFRGDAVLLPKIQKGDSESPSQATGKYVLRFSAVVETSQHEHEHDAVISLLSHVDTVPIFTKAKHPRFTKDLVEDVVQLLAPDSNRVSLMRHSEYQLQRLQIVFGHKTLRNTPNLCLVTEIFAGESELKWDDFLARLLYFHPHCDAAVLKYLLLDPLSGNVTRTAFKLLCEWIGKRWAEKLAQLSPLCRRHFHGLVTATEAEELLGAAIRDRTADVSGYYLIRLSTSTPGFFALTFTTEKAAKISVLAEETGPVNKKRKRAIRFHHLQLYVDEATRRLREDHDPAAVEYLSIEDFIARNTDVFRHEVTRKPVRAIKPLSASASASSVAAKPKRRKSDVTPSPQATANGGSSNTTEVTTSASAQADVSSPQTAVASASAVEGHAAAASPPIGRSASELSLLSSGVQAVEIAV